MEAKEILTRVKQYFNELTQSGVLPVAAEDVMPVQPAGTEYELKDGTKVMITDLTVGGIATIETLPAPIGEHELADGTKIVVGDNGVIGEVIVPAAQAAPEVVEQAAPTAAFETKLGEFSAAYDAKFAAFESKINAYEVQLSKANKVIESLVQLSTMLAEQPAAQPDAAVKAKAGFNETKQNDINDFANNLFKSIKK